MAPLYSHAVALLLFASLALAARVLPPPNVSLPNSPRLLPFARQVTEADLPRVPPSFNINSGGPAVGRFVADNPAWLVGTSDVFVTDDAVIGGAEPINLPMYRSHRFGVDASTWGYDIPVADPGTYACTVHFAETDAASFVDGRRVFDLVLATAHGPPAVFPNIDITAELAGAQFTVLTKTAPSLLITGILSVRVVSDVGNPIISGITCERHADLPDGVAPDLQAAPIIPTDAVVPTTPELTFPETNVDVNCGGPSLGRFVADTTEDYSWIRGETSMWEGPEGVVIGGAQPQDAPAVLSHRYGVAGSQWGYTIPVLHPGIYDCSLHFAETDTAFFVVGARVFDVTVNGVTLSDIDVFAETGRAEFTALVKTFSELTVTDSIVIDLKPKLGDAFLSAITCAKTAQLPFVFTPQPSATPATVGPQQTVTPPEMDRETLGPDTAETVNPDVTEPQVLVPQHDDAAATDVVIIAGGDQEETETPGVSETADAETAQTDDSAPPTATPEIVPPVHAPESVLSTATLAPGESETPESMPPATIATPAPINPDETDMPVESPSPEASTPVSPEDTTSPSPQQSPLVEPTAQAAPSSTFDAAGEPLDSLRETALTPVDSQLLISYNLGVTIDDGSPLTSRVRDAIKKVGNDGITGDLQWAATDISRDDDAIRQSDTESDYIMVMQVLYEAEQDRERSQARFVEFVQSGEMNDNLREEGYGNVAISIRDASNALGSESESLTQTSTIVAVIVGCTLLVMVMVSIVVFYVLRRKRRSGDDFDAPPPTMSESEMSSVVERTETAASIEYLDDDSTFTAATSRAGENPDQMAYVKDALGRGTDGAHGTTSL
ncbi:unnamed protein product [Agarophyton chilense]|eukprot:gb/GEZJ01001811.1/.p1 GENE.gb/GEZJ01001811.1/~~gb/GEZJ01001811.1/.p1  ORF type:complete len:839 (-),score=137.80 gb/GEZJ01001811.1/:4619-7135(-)